MLTVPQSGPNQGFAQMNHSPRSVLSVDADVRLVRDRYEETLHAL